MSRSFLRIAVSGVLLSGHVKTAPTVYNSKSQVTYHGTLKESVEHFQNIKYALDTSGNRRFAPPEPLVPQPGAVIDASIPGSACPQMKDAIPPFFEEYTEINEDCLSLRIARPSGLNFTFDSKLPVVVWLYGGGLVKGSAYDSHFEPDELIKLSFTEKRPIIYAALNYRSTIFGLARLPLLTQQKSLNVGMRDQRLGLQWIKDNIQAFGGDPERITAYGLSAGGTLISIHPMVYGGTDGVPFQQAWMMSGPPGTCINATTDLTAAHTLAVAEKVGCGSLNDIKTLKCLREVPMQHLIDNAVEYSITNHPPLGLLTFTPSVDGDFLPDGPAKLARAGRFVKGIRMVFGWTQDDGTMNAGLPQQVQREEDVESQVRSFAYPLSAGQKTRLLNLYNVADFEEDVRNYEAHKTKDDPTVTAQWFRLARILRDLFFTCSSIEYGTAMLKYSRATAEEDLLAVRLYALNQSTLHPLWKGAGMPYMGVSHGSDTNYVFNGLFPEGELSEEDRRLSQQLTQALINFAYTGDPSTTNNEWPQAYSKSSLDSNSEVPSPLTLQVIGGPHGSGPVTLTKTSDSGSGERSGTPEYRADFDAVGTIGKAQQFLRVVADNFGAMRSPIYGNRKRQVERERLFERCGYINSLADSSGL